MLQDVKIFKQITKIKTIFQNMIIKYVLSGSKSNTSLALSIPDKEIEKTTSNEYIFLFSLF